MICSSGGSYPGLRTQLLVPPAALPWLGWRFCLLISPEQTSIAAIQASLLFSHGDPRRPVAFRAKDEGTLQGSKQ